MPVLGKSQGSDLGGVGCGECKWSGRGQGVEAAPGGGEVDQLD